jgi:hypothetical protein
MTDQRNQDDLVITPGGPRRASQVHEVRPDQAVAGEADGGVGTVTRPHLLTPQLKALLDSGDYVVTPGGPRRKELVHIISPGEAVTGDQGVLRKLDARGAAIDLPDAGEAEPPALGRGWITYAAWTYSGTHPISSFTTRWVVPPAPAASESQLVYLFNGLQDSPVTHILQPVLQWGVSPDGGGAFWAVASWFVDSSGNAFKTPLVRVNPGDTLTGVMTLTGQSGSSYSYRCEFAGLSDTVLPVLNINQLVMPVETLECYGIQNCTDYPNTWFTAMGSIGLSSSAGTITPAFGAVNAVTDCGQHTVVVSNASPGGEVDLWYATQLTVPVPSVVTDLSRFRDHIDLFTVAPDGGVNSTFWDANGGWNLRWFRLGDPNFGDGFTIPPGSTVTSLSRFANHIDLFASGRDGGVYSTFWDASSGWFGHWFRLEDPNFGDHFTIPPGSPVTCLSRFRDHIDLFVTGRDGGVYSTFWDASSGWFGHWFRLEDPNFGDHFTIPPGSTVTSLCRFQDHIDLFVTGRDGGIYSTFWDASSGWFGHWFRV